MKLNNQNKVPYHRLLITSLSAWCLFQFIPLLYSPQLIFGQQAMIIKSNFKQSWYSISFFLINIDSYTLAIFSLFLLIITSLYQLFIKSKLDAIMATIQLLLIMNLSMYFYPHLSSGWVLAKLFFSYFIISSVLSSIVKNKYSKDHFLTALIKSQILLVYFMAFSHKIQGETWRAGSALKLALLHPVYSNVIQFVHFIPEELFIIGNYFLLFYQLSFPLVLKSKRWANAYVLTGVTIHLVILFSMGLSTFSIMMILGLLSFLYPNSLSDHFLKVTSK